jgi:hypothetical protein
MVFNWKIASIEEKIKHQEICRKSSAKIKNELFSLLGNRCIVCGYTGLALQLDHVNNNGAKDVREFGKGYGTSFYRFVLEKVKSGSKDYQLLCATHNIEKEMNRRIIEREIRKENKLKGVFR